MQFIRLQLYFEPKILRRSNTSVLHILADLCNNRGCANDCRRAKSTTIFLKIAHLGDFVQKLFSDFFSSPTFNLAAVHSWARFYMVRKSASAFLALPSRLHTRRFRMRGLYVTDLCCERWRTTSGFLLSSTTFIHIGAHNTLTRNVLCTAPHLSVRRVVGTFYPAQEGGDRRIPCITTRTTEIVFFYISHTLVAIGALLSLCSLFCALFVRRVFLYLADTLWIVVRAESVALPSQTPTPVGTPR